MEKYYITTAIDYANAAPHIGHAYEKIAADILARYHRLLGRDVFFLTGTDEHGSKVEKTAEAAGKSPKAFVDEMAGKFEAAWAALLISNDYFIRTTEPRHEKVVQSVFRKMRDKGDIYKGNYIGLYCDGCEDYLRQRDLVDGKCPNHMKAPVETKEENYFFKLTKYKDQLRQWLSNESVVKPDGRRREVINQLDDEDFGDFSVSRPRTTLQWGIPVPDDQDHVIYVWVDALTNYITGVGYETDEAAWKRFWPADLHLIGKDIVKFHSIYWIAMLMSCEIELPKLVFGHGFITVEGQKMSKSLGNVLDPIALVDKYGADAIRYYLFAANTFDQDGDFARTDFVKTVNSHLANNFGNLANRALTLIAKNCDGKVPQGTPNAACMKFADEAQKNYQREIERFEFAKAIDAARSILDEANRYINDQAPWKQFKEERRADGEIALLTALEMVKRGTILLSPFTPQLCNKVWDQLGFDGDIQALKLTDSVASNVIPAGQAVRNHGPVFMRFEEEEVVKA